MIMPPRLRKLALMAHVTSSVGWMGAVVAFLALAVVGSTSEDAQMVRGAYLVMEPAAWWVLVPFAFASLLTGLLMSLGTTWGLFRHYWVLFKLLINLFATVVLLEYMQADVQAHGSSSGRSERHRRRHPESIAHSSLRARLADIARRDGVGDLQAAGSDPVRPAQVGRTAHGASGVSTVDDTGGRHGRL